MGHIFSHVTRSDRITIEAMLKAGSSRQEIADKIGVHVSTIYREEKRGRYIHTNSDLTEEERYSPDIADEKYRENLKAKGPDLKIGKDHKLAEYIEDKIVNEDYSPGAVLGEIKQKGENQDKMPDEAVEGQSNVGVHEPAGFRQGHKAPQKPEILQKGGGSPASSFWEQGEDQAQVHGDAAQLKGKIPPVVDSGVGHQSEKELLVHLADSQDQAAQKQAADGIPAPPAEKDCQADGKRDPCQAEKYVKKGIGFRRRHGPCGQLQKSGYHSCSPWN